MGVRVETTRAVALKSVEDLLAEVARIEAVAREEIRAGVTPGAAVGTRVWVTGEWSLGQILQHLAIGVERSIGGGGGGGGGDAAARRKADAPARWDHDAAELGPDAQVWTDAGADRLRRALARVSGTGRERMGRHGIGHEEWLSAHLRHAEVHLAQVRCVDAASIAP